MACYISGFPSPEAGALKSLVMQYGSRSVRCSVLPSPGVASYRGRLPATQGREVGVSEDARTWQTQGLLSSLRDLPSDLFLNMLSVFMLLDLLKASMIFRLPK